MEPSLEDAAHVHRILQTSDAVIASFPGDLQPFPAEVNWSGGDIVGIAIDMNFSPTYAHGVYRAYRAMVMEACPELREIEDAKTIH